MIAVETDEIKEVKSYLEGILNEQGKQIQNLQRRMEEDSRRHQMVEDQWRRERQEWKEKEKSFNKKIRILQQKLGQGQMEKFEDDLMEKLEKDVEEKTRLIKSLMISLTNERSKAKELEQKILPLKKESCSPSSEVESPNKTSELVKSLSTASETTNPKDAQCIAEGQMQDATYEALSDLFKLEEQEEMVGVLDFSSVFEIPESSAAKLPSISDVYFMKHLKANYTQCCQCKKILSDHVVLSCGHEYCLKCGQDMIDLQTGNNFFCKVCNLLLLLPRETKEGLFQLCIESLPLSIKQLVRKLAMRKVMCEMCFLAEKKFATYYCFPCCIKVCSHCSAQHTDQSSIHLLINIERPILYTDSSENDSCVRLSDKGLASYCSHCKSSLCSECSVDHNGHFDSETIEYANSVNREIKEEVLEINKIISLLCKASTTFRNLQENGHQRMERIEAEIRNKTLMMRVLLDNQVMNLERELNYLTEINYNQLECMCDELNELSLELKHFKIYSEEFLEETKLNDMVYFGGDVLARVTELKTLGRDKLIELEKIGVYSGGRVMNPITISFTPFELRHFMVQTGGKNFIGALATKSTETMTSNAKLHHSFKPKLVDNGEKEVCGLTVLESELFIATRGNSSIEIFNLENFQLKRQMTGLSNISDIASCTKRNCLYVYGDMFETRGVMEVDLDGLINSSWSVHYEFGHISVTVNGDEVVVTGCNTNKLSEYTTNGRLIHQITLDEVTNILHLWHALKLDNGHFIVSHGIAGDAMHGVCIIDTGGNVLRSYEGHRSAVDIPVYLAFGEPGTVLVADLNNMRILQMNSILEFQQEIISKLKGLKWPYRIHFDFSKRQLFIASSHFLETWEILVFNVE